MLPETEDKMEKKLGGLKVSTHKNIILTWKYPLNYIWWKHNLALLSAISTRDQLTKEATWDGASGCCCCCYCCSLMPCDTAGAAGPKTTAVWQPPNPKSVLTAAAIAHTHNQGPADSFWPSIWSWLDVGPKYEWVSQPNAYSNYP